MNPAESYSPVQSGSRFWAVFDGAGAFASLLCMVHCVGLPILIVLFPSLSLGFVQAESFHQGVAIFAAAFAFVAFSKGYREHRSIRVAAMGLIGCFLLFFAAWWVDLQFETRVTVFGSLILIGAHLDNYRLVRRAGKNCALGHRHG